MKNDGGEKEGKKQVLNDDERDREREVARRRSF